MTQPTDPPAASEEPEPRLVCPCGSTEHAPRWIGATVSASGPERDFYDCPETAQQRYGFGGPA